MKNNYDEILKKFNNYYHILQETIGWKKPDDIDAELDFLNDVDVISQKYGYQAVAFGENEDKRVILFEKTK